MNCPKCGMNALPDETIAAVGFAYCKACGLMWSALQQAEIDRLRQELANLEDSFQTIARENNELEKELATEREKVRNQEKCLRAILGIRKENLRQTCIDCDDYCNHGETYDPICMKIDALLEEANNGL